MMSDLSTKKKNVFSISQYSFILIFIALFIVYFLFSTSLTWTGVTNILRHSAVIGVISLGMGLVIVTGDIDLSVGAMLSFVSSFACIVFNLTDSIFLVLCFCLLSGTLLGLINGVMIGKFRLPAFIVTLGTQMIMRSIAQYTCNRLPVVVKGVGGNTFKMIRLDNGSFDKLFRFGNGKFLSFPNCGLIFILIAILFVYITTSTKYGKKLFAIGSNSRAAHMSGINVEMTRISVFSIVGLLVGVGAFMLLAMQGNVDPATTGKNFEMYAIAAVVLGNISMSGGKGRFIGIIFGTLSYTVIDKIIAVLKVDSLINDAIKGGILLLAIVIQAASPLIKNYMSSKKQTSKK